MNLSKILEGRNICAWDLEKNKNIKGKGSNILYGLTDYNRCKVSIQYSKFIDYIYNNLLINLCK